MSEPPIDPYIVVPMSIPVVDSVRVPGSKSVTNRALVCAVLSAGTSRISGALFADDTAAMIDCLGQLGFVIAVDERDGCLTISSPHSERIIPNDRAALNAVLSGTTARFVAPLLLLAEGEYVLDGGESLRSRPMSGVFDAMRDLGAIVEPKDLAGQLPVVIRTQGSLSKLEMVKVAAGESSQFTSGLLLAGPMFDAGLQIEVPHPMVSESYIDLTLSVMSAFGAEVIVNHDADSTTYVVLPTRYLPCDFEVEPDASAASYFFAIAAITGSSIRVEGLGTASSQGDMAFVDVLVAMGCEVTSGIDWTEVRGPKQLKAVHVDMGEMSDTAQTFAAVAVFADGPCEVTGIGFIRKKESDRIKAVVTELARCGIDAAETVDGFIVNPGMPSPCVIATYDDHRMAMSFALLGLRNPGIAISDPGCVTKTFPDFWRVFESVCSNGASGGQAEQRLIDR